jgi:glycosyltransferase involved in cell wall biosynthesis
MEPSPDQVLRRLSVLLIPWWYPSEEDPILGRFVREHAEAISLCSDVVVLYSSLASKPIQGLYQIRSDALEDGIRTIRVSYRRSPIPRTTFFMYILSVLGGHKHLVESGFRADVFHAHEFGAGVAAVLLGTIKRRPSLITEHWSGFPRHLLRPSDHVLARFAFGRADIVCPVSENLKQHIEAYGIAGTFRVIPNPVNTALFYPGPPRKPWKDGKKHILFVGMLIPIKGLHHLLEALGHLKSKRDDFVLDVVGDGPDRAQNERLARNLGLDRLVRFHGTMTSEEVAEFMRRSEFLVSPSLWETMGVALIEAMACGKPVIASDVGGVRETVAPESGVLVNPADVDALSEAIVFFLDECHGYSPEGISQVARSRYAFGVIGAEYSRVYRRLIR